MQSKACRTLMRMGLSIAIPHHIYSPTSSKSFAHPCDLVGEISHKCWSCLPKASASAFHVSFVPDLLSSIHIINLSSQILADV